MKMIQDKELQYKNVLQNRLETYNENITGVRDYDQVYLYMYRDHDVLGYADIEYTWDWIIIRTLYYANTDILGQIMDLLKNKYEKAVGIQIKLWDQGVIKDLQEVNFQILGTFKDMPKGYERLFMTLYLEQVIHKTKLEEYSFQKKEDSKYNDVLSQLKTFPRKDLIDEKIEVSYVCLDNDTFIGGLHGYFQMNYFYLNFLYVEPEYRGKGISSRLMQIMEEEVQKTNIHNIFLFTCSFHAPEFYEKQGYTLQFTIEDEPKGYYVNMYYKGI